MPSRPLRAQAITPVSRRRRRPRSLAPATWPSSAAINGSMGRPSLWSRNHTAVAGPFTATLQLVNAAQRLYAITWPQRVVSRETIAPDQHSLSGGSQYGGVDAATRLTGSSGLVGTWNWNGVHHRTVNANGTYSVVLSNAKWHGTWQAVAGSPGAYVLTGSDLPTDKLALAADDSRLAGANQYGIAISGTRTDSCSAN